MNNLIVAVYQSSEDAGKAVTELKEKGYTKDISVITRDTNDVKATDVKKDVSDGAGAGAATCAAMTGAIACLTTLMVGAISVVLPGAGIVVLGPLAAGSAGAAAGAVAGGIIGALADAGFPEEKAKMYEQQIQSGDTLVSVTTSPDKSEEVKTILTKFSPRGVEVLQDQT